MLHDSILAPITARVCTSHHWMRTGPHPSHADRPLTEHDVTHHLSSGFPRGVCPIWPGTSTTQCALLDMDSHKGEVNWTDMRMHAQAVIGALAEAGLRAIPFRSSGGQGIHLYLLWKEDQDAHSVREALKIALGKCGFRNGVKGVAQQEIEVFPKQDSVPATGFGSMFILPLSGKSCALAPDTLDDIERDQIVWRASDSVAVRERPAPPERSTSETPADLALLKSALDSIPNSGSQELDYDSWRNVVFGIHSASAASDAGHHLAHEFSSRSSKYDPEFLDTRVWPYINSERDGPVVTARSVFALAQQHGWQDPTLNDTFPVTPPSRDQQPLTPTAGNATGQGGTRFSTQRYVDFTAAPPAQWLVKGVLIRAALAMIYGESGSGKSFWALDLGMHIAAGREWCGRKVRQGRVAFVVAEGAGGFRKRVQALVQEHKLDDLDMVFVTDAPDLMKVDDVKALIASLHAAGPLSVVFIDTYAAATPGANENSGEDMGKALYHCEQIARVTGAMVVLIHHSGKDTTKGARGWSGIRAKMDNEIEITRFQNERSAQVTKSKDGEDGMEFGFRLRVVELGFDDDQERITSCVVEQDTTRRPRAELRRREPKGPHEKLVMGAVRDLVALDGDRVTDTQVIDQAITEMVHDEGSGKADRRRDNARRALQNLIERGALVKNGEHISFPNSQDSTS